MIVVGRCKRSTRFRSDTTQLLSLLDQERRPKIRVVAAVFLNSFLVGGLSGSVHCGLGKVLSARYCMCWPPLIAILAPVTNASSEHRLTENDRENGGPAVAKAQIALVPDRIQHVGDAGETDRSAIAVDNDERNIIGGPGRLIVGIDLEVLGRCQQENSSCARRARPGNTASETKART